MCVVLLVRPFVDLLDFLVCLVVVVSGVVLVEVVVAGVPVVVCGDVDGFDLHR